MIRKIIFVLQITSIMMAKESFPDNVIPGEVIVKMAPNTPLLKQSSRGTGITEVDNILNRFALISVEPMFPTRQVRRSDLPDISRIYRVTYEADISPRMVAEALRGTPGVLYAEPNFIRTLDEIPNDSLFNNQWHLANIQAVAAWDVSHGDSLVLIGIVDSGMDMDHPDLVDNVWVNEAELNGIEGVDDDGNGYIDDIRGWDFVYNDNDPDNVDPNNLHGTHVAGLANAVTDNETGVAGVAWNVKMIITKHGEDQASASIINGFSGIIYAAEMGADVINCSWGGGGYSQYEQDVIQYVTGLGALVIAAAGNANSSDFHYPSAYEKVLSVAATNGSDEKASFSNYGISVDVSAPGVSTLSTFPQGQYGSISGTSMASPITAGLAALVKSFYPELTPESLALRVAGTTDNIDELNLNYAGLLGTGRINANLALTLDDSQLTTPPPAIRFLWIGITDSIAGNGDGVFDVGEEVHFSVHTRNYSLGSTEDYNVTLTTEDSDLTIINGISNTYSFPMDTIQIIENEMNLFISDNAAPHMAKVAFTLFVKGEIQDTDTLSFTVGKMPILIVKDDHESCCGDVEVSGFYTRILDEEGLNYGIWDHASMRSPSLTALKSFPIVIWFTEWDFPSLDSLDIVALKEFLESGGNLYLSGQDLGWDLNENPGLEFHRAFYSDYLHAQWGGDDAGTMEVIGIDNDPIGDKLSFPIYQPGLTSGNQYPDWFTPDSMAHLVFQYNNGLGMGLRYEGEYRLVYTGVGLEAFGSDLHTVPPDDINDIQRTVFNRILTYLNFIQHQPLTDLESTNVDHFINAHISGDLSDLESVTLYYRTEETGDFTRIDMADLGGGDFTATIPALGVSSEIQYYIETMNSYYSWTSPIGAPEHLHTFYAGTDTVPPVIESITNIKDQFGTTGSVGVTTEVSDNIGIEDVELHYTISSELGDTSFSLPMTSVGLDTWQGEIVWSDIPWYSVITYYVEAIDSSSQQNITVSDAYTFKIVKWVAIGNWEAEDLSNWDTGDGWGLVTIGGHGNVINDSPNGLYDNNANNVLAKLTPMDISYYDSAYLLFWHEAVLEVDKDFGYVELSGDGIVWDTVSTITGIGTTYEEVIDLSNYLDIGSVYLRFRMTSNEEGTLLGWYIDDVFLFADTTFDLATSETQGISPLRFSLLQNYPNPFNPITTIGYTVPQTMKISLIIYDLLGREVERLVDKVQNSGIYEVQWNAFHHASGIYFYQLRAGDIVQTKKMVVIK